MISITNIWAIVIRNARVWKQDINLLLAGFYWPFLDILIWGFLGTWIQQSAQFPNYELVAFLGILLWQAVGRGTFFIAVSFTEELWNNNVVNLFSLPLRTIEWMLGTILFYLIMTVITAVFCVLGIFILYDISIAQLMWALIIFMPPLFFSGIWIGLTSLQIIVMQGKRGIELAYVIGWFLLPFSGAYYPIDVLPAWAQNVSALLPMTPVFAGMRGYVMYQQDPTAYVIKGYVLGAVYAAIAMMLFIYFFNRTKRRGLARLVD